MPETNLPKIIDLFVYSDLFNTTKTAEEWCCNNVPFFNENNDGSPYAITKPVSEALIELGKKLDIKKEDIAAIFTEIGANVDEENGAKMRAVVGRWVNNAGYDEVVAFLLGYLKLSVVSSYNTEQTAKALGLLEEDGSENLVVPFTICVAWCLLIETGMAADKGLKDNTVYMPTTLPVVVAIDKMSRIECKSKVVTAGYTNLCTIFRTFMDIFINNHNRYQGKRPHESEITYMVVVKNALKRIGVDPSEFVYRALDNKDNQDWGLFAFLTDNV